LEGSCRKDWQLMQLAPFAKQQFFDDDGNPLVGGKINTYIAGTTTNRATYTDAGGGTENANPIILDGNGEANIWLDPALSYKFVFKTSADVVLRTVDNIETLPDDVVSTDKLLDGAVTPAKMADLDTTKVVITNFSTSNTSATNVTGAASITATGRPVKIGLLGETAGADPAHIKITAPSGVAAIGVIEIFRGVTKIGSERFGVERGETGIHLQTYAAGTHEWVAPYTGWALIKGCAGGGAGGGSFSTNSGGGGGGGGGDFSWEWLYVTAGVTYDIVVGAGGAGVSNADGYAGANTTVTTGGEPLLRWNGGAGGIKGADVNGAGGAGGAGSGNGGAGGAGGAGDPGTGIVGTAGSRGTGKHGSARGGTVTASTPSAGNGGGGGGGGGSIGVGGNGPSNTGAGHAAAGMGGGGAGARGVASANTAGYSGGDGELKIYDASSLPGATNTIYIPPSAICMIDDPDAGTHSYSLKVWVTNAAATLSAQGTISIQAVEL
jgi:hypothetical protein